LQQSTGNNILSIVIPNINGLEHLKICLPSILAQSYTRYKVILVDNGSVDGSADYVKESIPDSEIIRFNNNTGFAKAVNEGIKTATSKYNTPYILLLNNDIELPTDFLQTALDTFNTENNADIIAVKMMNFYNRNIIDDTGNFLTRRGGTAYPRGNGQEDKGQFDKPEYIFGACAGAAFYKKEVFEHAGLFDEKFFAYLEDIDLSFRAQLMGFKCFYQPKAVCYHKRGGSSISTFQFQAQMNERNIIWVRIKNYPFLMYIKYQPRFLLTRLRRLQLILKHHGFSSFLAAVKGYFAGIFYALFMLGKRFHVQKNKKVSSEYIYSLFR
jgi:GT2 family glycosyltransferase